MICPTVYTLYLRGLLLRCLSPSPFLLCMSLCFLCHLPSPQVPLSLNPPLLILSFSQYLSFLVSFCLSPSLYTSMHICFLLSCHPNIFLFFLCSPSLPHPLIIPVYSPSLPPSLSTSTSIFPFSALLTWLSGSHPPPIPLPLSPYPTYLHPFSLLLSIKYIQKLYINNTHARTHTDTHFPSNLVKCNHWIYYG